MTVMTEAAQSYVQTARYTESHIVTLLKTPGSSTRLRRLSEPSIKANIDTIIASTFTGARVNRGWSGEIRYRLIDPTNDWDTSRIDAMDSQQTFYDVSYVPESAATGHLEYRAYIVVNLDTDKKRDSVRVELESIVTTIAARGQYPKWSVVELDSEPFTVKASTLATGSIVTGGAAQLDMADAVGYAPCVVPANWQTNFKDLYGVDDQISMVKDALDTALHTSWAKRFHTKLIGPPGCGKSAILRAMKQAVGEEAVMEFDATSTTAAGAMEMLSEFEELPRIMVVEELEKGPTDTFQFLLGLMDDRAEVRKITARKKIFRETRLLVFATVNDEVVLDRLMDGALSSRFSNPIYFSRPSRALLAKILERECRLYHGSEDWIDPALDLADALNVSDPRRVISLMMLGKQGLVTGDYQRRLLTVGMAHKDESDETIDSTKSRLAALVTRIQEG